MRHRVKAPGIVTICHSALTILVFGALGNEMMQEVFNRFQGTQELFLFTLWILMMPLGTFLSMDYEFSGFASFVIFAGLNSILVGYGLIGLILWANRRFRERTQNTTNH